MSEGEKEADKRDSLGERKEEQQGLDSEGEEKKGVELWTVFNPGPEPRRETQTG